jgi:PKD domain
MNSRMTTTTALAALVAALIGASAASADTYCVTPASGCTHPETSVANALTAAAADSSGAATIRLGATTYNEDDLNYIGAVPLTVTGAGQGQTTLTDSGASLSGRVLRFTPGSATATTLSNLALAIPATNAQVGVEFGSQAVANVQSVTLNGPLGAGGASGFQLDGAGTLSQTAATLLGTGTTGVQAAAGSALSDTIQDSSITANTGVSASGVGTTTVHRTTITTNGSGGFGLNAGAGSASIDESLVLLRSGGTGILASSATQARQVTIVGDASGTGVNVDATAADVTLGLTDSIIRNVPTSVSLSETSPHVATLTSDYDDFQGATNASDSHIAVSGGAAFTPGAHNIDLDPLFAGASSFHPLPTSPVLNRDATAIQSGESATDLIGLPRFVSGTTRDLGAYQHQAPRITSAAASPSTQVAGKPVTFNGVASDSDPGDSLSYAWAFDDGTTATGPTVTHAFASKGTHTGTLTVTDATNLRASASASVTVTAAPPASTSKAPETKPPPLPVIVGVSIDKRVFAVGGPVTPVDDAFIATLPPHIGTTFRFSLNTGATVAISFTQLLPGRLHNGVCGSPPANRRKRNRRRPCVRQIDMGVLTRSEPGLGSYAISFSGQLENTDPFPVGRYSATIGAVDATGIATPQILGFKIVAAARRAGKQKARPTHR